MNYSIIIYIIGYILEIEAAFMALPLVISIIYRETSGYAFLITIILCLALGIPMTYKKSSKKAILYQRRFRDRSTELDRIKYYGCSSLCDQRKYSPPCGCAV